MAAIFSHWRTTVPAFAEANTRVESLWGQWPEGHSTLTLLARRDLGPGDESRPTHLLHRGDWLRPGPEVAAGVPGFLHPLPEPAGSDRLTFARWLVDRRSPTTARSLVNRVWQQYFGSGLVETSEDLGTQAPPPSHPELLDWLAVEFMEPAVRLPGAPEPAPWSLKHLHRLIVHSATYRQSSHARPEDYANDPANRLLARGPRPAQPGRSRDRSRHRPRRERTPPSRPWRPARPTASSGLPLPAPCQLRPKDLGGSHRTRPLPARALHLPLPQRPLPRPPGFRRP